MSETQNEKRLRSQSVIDRQKIAEEQSDPVFRDNLARLREERHAREAAKKKKDNI